MGAECNPANNNESIDWLFCFCKDSICLDGYGSWCNNLLQWTNVIIITRVIMQYLPNIPPITSYMRKRKKHKEISVLCIFSEDVKVPCLKTKNLLISFSYLFPLQMYIFNLSKCVFAENDQDLRQTDQAGITIPTPARGSANKILLKNLFGIFPKHFGWKYCLWVWHKIIVNFSNEIWVKYNSFCSQLSIVTLEFMI